MTAHLPEGTHPVRKAGGRAVYSIVAEYHDNDGEVFRCEWDRMLCHYGNAYKFFKAEADALEETGAPTASTGRLVRIWLIRSDRGDFTPMHSRDISPHSKEDAND
jgi:hypothetical protein